MEYTSVGHCEVIVDGLCSAYKVKFLEIIKVTLVAGQRVGEEKVKRLTGGASVDNPNDCMSKSRAPNNFLKGHLLQKEGTTGDGLLTIRRLEANRWLHVLSSLILGPFTSRPVTNAGNDTLEGTQSH